MATKIDPKTAYWAAVYSDFGVFVQQAFATLYMGTQILPNWHLEAMIHCLEQATEGSMRRLIINLPPRHLKSFLVSVAWPAFILGRDPSAKIICVSYSDDLSRDLSRDFRRLIESDWYLRVFNKVHINRSTENETTTDAGGSRYATSIGGTLTGRGADIIIIDDPIKAEDAQSDHARNRVNSWYGSTLLSRLNDKQRGILVIVMQRLHVNDLTGYASANGAFHHLSLPALATRDERISLRNGAVQYRYKGDVLHPERESRAVLEEMRRLAGPRNFQAQYQQDPESPDGAMFKRSWIQLIRQRPKESRYGHLYVSIDSAASTAETADYSVFTMIYVDDSKFYVVDVERGRWDYEALLAKTLNYEKNFGGNLTFAIEGASTGISLILSLRQRGISVVDTTSKRSKDVRASIALPYIADRRLYVVDEPGRNAWVKGFLDELLSFPHGRHDDQVDSVCQLIPYAARRHGITSAYINDYTNEIPLEAPRRLIDR